MNKSTIKFITDFGPLLIFFIFYKKYGMQEAILPLIIATAISIAVIYLTEKKVPAMPLISGILVAGFGGLTIYFNDKTFFYMKPTIINLLFAMALLYGKLILKTSLLKKVIGANLKLTDEGWNILTDRWIYFFIFIAVLNEFVWRTQTEDLWVQFKVFGMIPITVIYTFFQVSIINKHRIDE
jgi:intracellular septation protein|tara:strand:- start:582 stop:1127 length:546 start_codon:yes stop_codon:yes gene_type:complete